jgi:hypothetical protein
MVKDLEAMFSRGIDLKLANIPGDRVFGEDRASLLLKEL